MRAALIIIGAAAGTALLMMQKGSSTDIAAIDTQDGTDATVMDSIQTAADEALATVSGPGPVTDMTTSQSMLDMLKRRERLTLTRYALGDGGYTWGYGHFSKSPDALPVTITPDQAESIFADDVMNRAEKWVKLYVTVSLSQNQFDALVSIAFNMSPQSFKKFADQVNAGNGISGMAMESVAWVSTKFTNGIRNRRDAEINVFDNGVYA